MSETPARFRIYWKNGEYKVSIPNYQGGEVVRAEVADALIAAVELVMENTGHFYDCLPGKRGQAPSDDCSIVCKRLRAALKATREG